MTRFLGLVRSAWIASQTGADNAWIPERLEYQFATSAPMPDGTEKVYVAEEYYPAGSIGTASTKMPAFARSIRARRGSTGLPPDAPFTHDSRPSVVLWHAEHALVVVRRQTTNFGDIDASTTDLAKLLFMEFALVYSNDWFVVPSRCRRERSPGSSGLAVTNVFGERFWIEAAGRGIDKNWQRWSMFTINVRNGPRASAADTTCCCCQRLPSPDGLAARRSAAGARRGREHGVGRRDDRQPADRHEPERQRGRRANPRLSRRTRRRRRRGRTADGGGRPVSGDEHGAGAVDSVHPRPCARRQSRNSIAASRNAAHASGRARREGPAAHDAAA